VLENSLWMPPSGMREKNRQATYIAPLNHLSLLYSYPGEVQQELVVEDLPTANVG